MSNNRNNNRRRGRGSNRSQGGNQLNRIDSRARGNAPQLLEKYRKLAHDASLNGDRVQAEYYLQFADHYFRVIADSRAQKDEVRPRRDAERDDFDDFEDEGARTQSRGRGQYDEPQEFDDGERGGERGREGADVDEQEVAENPFIRDSRASKPRRPRRERPKDGAEQADEDGEADVLDPAALPPAIVREDAEGEQEEEAPRRQRRPRTRRKGDDETLEVVS